jgi:predicted ArsR family transcriptional regulator
VVDLPLVTSARDPLAQPTRARLYELLDELARPADTAELAERLGLHANGVRVHLERMEREGLVVRTRVRQPVGRPRHAWALAPDALPGGQPPSAYADLARWLARSLRSDPGSQRRVEATGREIGREIASPQEAAGAQAFDEAFELVLARLGFQPVVKSSGADRLTVCLGNCPYRDAVRENRDVCTLHRGITLGLLDRLGTEARLEEFVPHDPDEAGCLIELSGVGGGADPA